jgi:peroxiredoxin
MKKLASIKLTVPVLCLLASSVTLNPALAYRVHRQSALIRALTPAKRLPIGAAVPALRGEGPAGTAMTISAKSSAGTLLYVYAPECGWCIRNAENMKVVIEAARKRGMAIYGVSLAPENSRQFLTSHGIDVPVVIPDETTRRDYGFSGTPQTLVLSAEGTVLRNWRGAYVEKTAGDVSAFFDISLPGLSPVKQAN